MFSTLEAGSASNGAPITSGNASVWAGVVQTGGQVAPGTDMTVLALCARPPNL
jgi:hypothetical protein